MRAKHYVFTDEELDFVINYDIKYRMFLSGGEKVDVKRTNNVETQRDL